LEILVQSILRETNQLSSAIHIRYWDRKTSPDISNPSHPMESALATETGTYGRKASYIILRKDYAYLKPIIQETFHEAEGVRVFIDRRSGERRKPQSGNGKGELAQERRAASDRRASSPILDIIIALDATTG
jgi:hypothetical protein